MRKLIIVIVLMAGVSMISYAQSKSGYRIEGTKKRGGGRNSDWMQNVFVQPNFGFAFGSNTLYLNVSPTVGYRILEGWDAGFGINYIYSSTKASPGFYGYTSDTWGGNLFTRYLIKEPFFVIAQYEFLGTKYSVEAPNNGNISPDREYYDAFLAGGGVMQPIGRNGAFVLSVLYNFNYDSNDPYGNGPYTSPYAITAGVMVGF